MTSLTTLNIDTSPDILDRHIANATDEQLKDALSTTVQVTAKYLSLLARIWRELESRGVDLSDLRSGIAYYLPMIADNTLDPSVVLAFAGQQLLLRELSLMPIDRQVSIAEGEKLEVVSIDDNGEAIISTVNASSLHSRHYSQVFNLGKVRTASEQLKYLQNLRKKRAAKSKRSSKPVKKKKISYDSKNDAMIFDSTAVLFDDVIRAISIKIGVSEDRIRLAVDSLGAAKLNLKADSLLDSEIDYSDIPASEDWSDAVQGAIVSK